MESKETTNKFYYCYSPKQKKYLSQHNIRYITTGTHKKTNKDFWVYERNSDLDAVLKNWL